MDLQYPVGKFTVEENLSDARRSELIGQIAEAPGKLRDALKGLDAKQLDTPYRDGGWTLRQVAHHLADSHMNAYVRFKLALTEETPAVKPFKEAAWAELPDSHVTPIDVSLALVESLHARWVVLLRSLKPADWERPVLHSEAGPMSLNLLLGLYAWHGAHHVAQISALRARNQW